MTVRQHVSAVQATQTGKRIRTENS